MEPWLMALEPYLPPHLRRTIPENDIKKPSVPAVEYARLLIDAQASSQDILSHLGMAEGRWDAVMWLIKHLVEEGTAVKRAAGADATLENTVWKDTSRTLKDLTESPIYVETIRKSHKLGRGLKELTSAPETIQYQANLLNGALGQVWRSLGTMILVSTEEQPSSSSTVMSRILEIIAYLHHVEMIPKAIYHYPPAHDSYALQQPPTLHLLSSKILTSLSDATWRAHEASAEEGKDRFSSQYILGYEIPGSRYKITVPEIGPEIWVELVLWSCLHGGWILDGVAILEKLLLYGDEKRWSVICWRDIVTASTSAGSLQEAKHWEKLAAAFEYPNRSYASDRGDRRLVQRTISSEVIAAFVDGLTNMMRVGVGARGNNPEDILLHIKNLKQLLDQNNLSLGTSSWDAIIFRLLESHGIRPEKKPDIVLSMLTLSQAFGIELASANVALEPLQAQSSPNYVFEASAAPIGLLHRTLRAFIELGHIAGVIKALGTLQEYTDNNKLGSVTAFFNTLKQRHSVPDNPFASNTAPIDFPAFFPEIPTPLLADMLDLLARTQSASSKWARRVCEWLLFSKDLDGPLIPPSMYGNWLIAPSVIRYGTVVRNNKLLLDVVQAIAVPGSENRIARLPHEVLSAFLDSQIESHQWGSVRSISQYAMTNSGYRPQAKTLAMFVKEMLLESTKSSKAIASDPNATAKAQFANLLTSHHKKIEDKLQPERDTILGILSTVHPDFTDFCKTFMTATGRQCISIELTDFNTILAGVARAYGSVEAKRIVDQWCATPRGRGFQPYRSPGGVPQMAKYRPSRGLEYEDAPPDIEVDDFLSFRGRITPNVHTYRVLLWKARSEKNRHDQRGTTMSTSEELAFKETLNSVVHALRNLGLDIDDVSLELRNLAEDVEIPAEASTMPAFGSWDEEGDDDYDV
jgi:hypothetical protein